MRKRLRLFLLAVGSLVGTLDPSWVEATISIPPVPDHYVNDAAGLLSPKVRDTLDEKLAQFERDTSNQVLVATFSDLQGESIEDFSIRLAEKWKPGQSGRDNGVILLISKGDRKARVEVGYGLEGAIPDAVAKAILQQEMLPAFRQGNFEGGIQAGVEAILKASAGEYKALPQDSLWPLWVFFIIVALLLVILLSWINPFRSYGLRRTGAYQYGGWGGTWGGSSGGGWSGGSSSSSGGFSSGGGSFGGGGASGSW